MRRQDAVEEEEEEEEEGGEEAMRAALMAKRDELLSLLQAGLINSPLSFCSPCRA